MNKPEFAMLQDEPIARSLADGPSELMRLFREWCILRRETGAAVSDHALNALSGKMRGIERRIASIPAGTAGELAAKFLALTNYGDLDLDHFEVPFIEEAAALAGEPIPRNAMVRQTS